MHKNGIRKRKYRIAMIITAVVNICGIIAVVFLMNYVQKMLTKDMEINLKEIVIQNQQVITSKLNLELNEITGISKILAKDIYDTQISAKYSDDMYKNAIDNYCKNEDLGDKHNIFLANYNSDNGNIDGGKAFFSDEMATLEGGYLDIKNRDYYIMATQGKNNIRLVTSRLDSEPVFILSVPMYVKGVIRGTVHKFLSPQQMNEICSLSRFSDLGYMHIIDSDGEIVVQSDNFVLNQGDNKFFRILAVNENLEQANQLKIDIANDRANFMEVLFDKEPYYCAYTPIENLDDWYLISSISVNEVSANSNGVVRMFYIIMFIVVILAGISGFLFLLYKNKKQAYIEKIAFVDNVTQGNTLAKFTLEFNNIIALSNIQYSILGILVFDVDNFKYINSYYGYEFGDKVLKTIYDTVKNKLSNNEVLARVTGDRFIALIENYDEKRVLELLDIKNIDVKAIYMSAGVYKITDINENISLMFDKASIALQSVKNNLHDKIGYYSVEYDEEGKRNEQMKRDITQALSMGEIIPYYQPKVDIHTRKVIGAEALARWCKNDGKLISPVEFIPLCEKTGQIVDVDMAIFEKTLSFLAENLKKNIPCVPISVNFSRINLKNPLFVHQIVNKIYDYQVPASLIQVEITESAVFEDYLVISEFVRHLHMHGLIICIDDFGSGYSSLNMLKDLPVDILKVDKMFLNTKGNTERQDIILSIIKQMAEKLQMEVVVEGVETLENVQLMEKIGYYIAQGYFFARPMCEIDFQKLFEIGEV